MQAFCKQWRFFLIFCYLFVIYDLQAATSPISDEDSSRSVNTLFPSPALLPPTDLRGHQVENEFASQTDIINVITWNPPEEGPPPVAYYIYRHSDLKHRVAVIPASKNLKFKDHNRQEDHTYTYFIVSVDEYKNKSAAACIIFKGSKARLCPAKKAKLIAIEVSPLDPLIAVGFTQQFTALGIFSDGTTKDLTKRVTWSSADPTIASISNAKGSQGLATALSPGTTVITATLHGVTGSATLTVTKATLVSLEVNPMNSTLANGFTRKFTAIGIFNDGTKQDLTNRVTWTSTNPTVASISNATGSKGLVTALSPGTTTITASLNGVTGSTTLTVTEARLVSIDVEPANPTIATGFTQEFTAIGIFSDGSTQDLTQSVTWTSSDPTVASLSADGNEELATGLNPGTTLISASLNGMTGSTTLTVTAAVLVFIDVEPVNPIIAAGFTQEFTAIGIFSDSTKSDLTEDVTWTSSDPTVASLSTDGNEELATGLSPGTTLISASLNGVTGSTTLTVTPAVLVFIDVEPVNLTIAAGFTQEFTAIGIFSDATKKDLTEDVKWMSSDPTVATISNAVGNEGLATGLSPGTTMIEAMMQGVTGSTTLTVTPAILVRIEVDPMNPTIAAGFKQQFTATGIFSDGTKKDLTESVVWVSSESTVATISNADENQGLATSSNPGTTTIEASKQGVIGSTILNVTPAVLVSIEVSPRISKIAAGFTQQFTATGVYSDGTKHDLTQSVTWTSSDPTIASISNATTPSSTAGLATGYKEGSVTIKATEGISGTAMLTVNPAILLSIEVTPSSATIGAGFTQQFTATGTFSDGSTHDLTQGVAWTSSDSTIASISNHSSPPPSTAGVATGITQGNVTITATFPLTSISGIATLTVTPAILVSIEVIPSSATIAAGFTQQFTATGTLSDGSTKDLTQSVIWTSSDPGIASISNHSSPPPSTAGLATGITQGNVTITATDPSTGISGIAMLTVSPAVLVSIAVKPANPTITAPMSIQFTATGTLSDGSTKDMTTRVTWTSSDPTIASISNDSGKEGVATGLFAGNTTITALDSKTGISGNTTLTVCPAITITTPSPLPNARAGTFYSQTLQTSGGIAPVTFTLIRGSPPDGISLSSDGVISGITNGPGFFPAPTFVVQAMSSCGSVTTHSYQIFVNCVIPLFTSGSPLPSGQKNTFYSFQFTASGAPPTISFSVFGGDTLPPGLTLSSSGLLSGTPTSSGTFTFGVQEGNACGAQVKNFQLTIK